ncbi:tetratricopeptide repeat protein [Lusitaniella coriacea]|uniref:tetratricopeptide repeat protein n=1 Tax=Lusitaniella coriacea TaxID=1983105 RepID=UPI003CED5821
MNETLPTIYISILLGLLTIASGVILVQIFKVRRKESKLSKLQNKLKKEKGTALEYYELGSVFLDKKMFTQATKAFDKALKAEEIIPENKALIYNGLGYAYFANEQHDLAIRQYKEAIKYNPEYVIALNNLGHVYEQKKLIAQAVEVYEESLKYEPKNATAKRRVESLRKRLVTSS